MMSAKILSKRERAFTVEGECASMAIVNESMYKHLLYHFFKFTVC